MIETLDGCAERRQRFEQHLAVLPSGDLPRGQRAAVAGPDDVEVHGTPGVTGPQVVDVHAVRYPSRRGPTGRHQGLPGDVAADDVVARVVQLSGHEAVVRDLVDLQRGDDLAQRRRSEAHPGIMPQRFSHQVVRSAKLGAHEVHACTSHGCHAHRRRLPCCRRRRPCRSGAGTRTCTEDHHRRQRHVQGGHRRSAWYLHLRRTDHRRRLLLEAVQRRRRRRQRDDQETAGRADRPDRHHVLHQGLPAVAADRLLCGLCRADHVTRQHPRSARVLPGAPVGRSPARGPAPGAKPRRLSKPKPSATRSASGTPASASRWGIPHAIDRTRRGR